MLIVVAAASILVFVLAISRSGLVAVCSAVLSEVRRATRALRDPALDDLAKQHLARRAAARLFGFSMSILLRGALVLGLALVPVGAADLAGLAPARSVLDWMVRPEVIVVTSVVLMAGYFAGRRLWPRS